MKIVIDWYLESDGDYTLNNASKYGLKAFDYADGTQVVFESDVNDMDCRIKAQHYLSEMFCDLKVASSHYYIYKSLYRLFDNCIEFIRKYKETDGDVVYTEVIGGNYEGTEITVQIYV